MYQDDYFNLDDQNDYESEHDVKKMLEKEKTKDRGYNTIYRKTQRPDGRTYNKKIKIYTSSGIGSHIRDVETGEYSSYIVGSKDENLFFKIILATGQCKSANNSSTLFFISPQHYASYLQCEIDPETVRNWEVKRDARLAELRRLKKSQRIN
jgi:hypothetical protein